MTIYVDDVFTWPTKGQWCHMMTDGDVAELHQFAATIGLQRHWFQDRPSTPHYDLRPSKRVLAIRAGAIAVDAGEMLKRCKKT